MTCPGFAAAGPRLIADTLAAVDCRSAESTAAAFARLFGSQGLLTAVLTLTLTLYVALFALGLLTGRSRLGLAALTPRALTLGLVLTFATSWAAYSQVIWGLLTAGPDWLAATLLGLKGSASEAFAARLDDLFQAVAQAAEAAQQASADRKGTTPADLLSYAALLLLLGTVGVLVTCRIALTALLALGPVFLLLALFAGTRGLFAGWVRGAVLFALAPLFATLIGAGSLAMLGPVVAGLDGGEVSLEQAAAVFVGAAVHCALMAMALKVVTVMTAGWDLDLGRAVAAYPDPSGWSGPAVSPTASSPFVPVTTAPSGPAPLAHDRLRDVITAVSRSGSAGYPAPVGAIGPAATGLGLPAAPPAADPRVRAIIAQGRGAPPATVPATTPIKETLA